MFGFIYIAIYLCLTQSNAFIGKNIGLPSRTPKVKPKSGISTYKRDDEHPRHDFQIGVPGGPWWGDGGWGEYVRMHD